MSLKVDEIHYFIYGNIYFGTEVKTLALVIKYNQNIINLTFLSSVNS